MYSNFHRLIRFYFAGFMNTLLSYCIFAGLIYLGIIYWLAIMISYTAGLAINYKSIKMIAFSDSKKQSFRTFFFIFCGMCLLNIGLTKVFIDLGINAYLSAWLVVIPISIISYELNKKYVFNLK
jgi:putative flippase GtrA